MDELVKYVKALLLLQVRKSADGLPDVKPELLLANAGLSAKEVGEILGKSEAAASKAISRARKAAEGDSE